MGAGEQGWGVTLGPSVLTVTWRTGAGSRGDLSWLTLLTSEENPPKRPMCPGTARPKLARAVCGPAVLTIRVRERAPPYVVGVGEGCLLSSPTARLLDSRPGPPACPLPSTIGSPPKATTGSRAGRASCPPHRAPCPSPPSPQNRTSCGNIVVWLCTPKNSDLDKQRSSQGGSSS